MIAFDCFEISQPIDRDLDKKLDVKITNLI
jgi:hypothetical protein